MTVSKTQKDLFVYNRNCFPEKNKAHAEIICIRTTLIFEQQEFIRN